MKENGIKHVTRFLVFGVLLWIDPIPTYASVTLNSSLNVTETYTDNLFFESQRNKRDDFGTFIVPSLTLTYQTQDVVLSGTYVGTAQFYVNNSNANAYIHNGNIAIDLPFLTKRYKGLEIRLIESFNFTPALQGFSFEGDRADQNVPIIPGQQGQGGLGGGGLPGGIGGVGGTNTPIGNRGVFTGRSGSNSFQNRAGIIVRYQLSPRWVPNARYENRYVTFTDSELNDSLTHTIGAGTSYLLSSRTQLNANYGVNISDINNGDTVVSHTVIGGVVHTLNPTVTVNVNAGVSYTESAERFTFTSNANISKVFDPGSITIGYSQNVTPGGGLATSGVLTQRGIATLSYPLAERVSVAVSGGVAKNKSLSGNSVDVTSYQGQVGFNLILLRWLSGTVGYSYIKQKSKGTAAGGRSATVNQGFIGLTAELPEFRLLR